MMATLESFGAASSSFGFDRHAVCGFGLLFFHDFCRFFFGDALSVRKDAEHVLQQFGHAVAGLGGDGQQLLDAEAAKLLRVGLDVGRVHFVDRQQQRLAHANQLARQFDVGCGQFGAAIDHHHDGVGLLQRDLGLAENLGGDQRFVFGNDAAGIDHAQRPARPFGFAVETVAGDAGLVADDGAARSDEAVEERRFADVGAADNGQRSGQGHFSRERFGAGFVMDSAGHRTGALSACAVKRFRLTVADKVLDKL